jgi:2-polyprenyl-3-methyl-5-hydroxy-6-metoxy-1,4-benzoquinol methylase
MSLGLNPQRSSPAAVIDRSPSAPSVPSDSTAKPEQRIAFGEGAAGRVGTAILKKSFGPALKKMEEHGAMLLIRNGGKYLPTTITKLVISQVETKLGDMTAVQLSNPKLVMALIGSIQLEGLGMTVGALATKSGVSLVSSVATAVTVEQFKRQAEQAENNKPLTDKIWKVLGDVADALNPLSMGGAGENSTMDSQRTYNEAYQRNLKQLQEAQRQLDAQKPVGQDNTRATAPATPPQVRQPTPAEIANVQKQLDASRPSLPRPIAIPGYTDTRPSEPVSAPLVGVGIVGGRAEQYTAQQLADRMQKFAGTTGGVQPASIFNWVKVSESGKFDTTLITQPVANKETAQAIAFNKKSLTVQLAVPVDYWDQTSKQHTQGYLQFKGLDPRAVLTKFNDYLVSLHGTQSFNVRGNFEDILKNSGLSVDGLKQRAQYFDNTDLAKNLPVIGGKQATLGTADMAKDLATVKHNNALNLSQGQPNKLSVLIPTNPGSYDGKPRHLFAEGIGANNAAALLQYAAEHGLLRPGTSPAQVIQANGLSSVLGIDASGQVSVLPKAETPKAETPKTLTEKEIKEAWEKLGGSELGEQIVRHADREGLSSKDVLEHIQRNPGKNLNEILAGLRDGNLSFGGTPPNGGGGRNTTVAGGADGQERDAAANERKWAEYNSSTIGTKEMSQSILSNYRAAVSKKEGNSGRVIDIGPGRGETVRGILNSEPNAKVVAIDIDKSNLKAVENTIPENQKSRFESVAGNVTEVDFGTNNTNLVVAERLFPHLSDAEVASVLQKSHKALQPEGIVVCDFFTTEHMYAKTNTSANYRSVEEARKLVEKDFDILKEENVGPMVKYTLRKRELGAQPSHQLDNQPVQPKNQEGNGIKFDPIPQTVNSELNSAYFQGKYLSLKLGEKSIESYNFAGRDFSASDLAKIARAPDGSEVKIITYEGQPNRLRLEVKNTELFAKDAFTEIWIDSKSGNLNIKNLYYSLSENSPEGLGLQAINQQVQAAKAIGAKTVFSDAFSSGPVGADKTQLLGPYVWGQYGFDANLPSKIAVAINAPEGITRVSQLYDEPSLQARWKEYVLKNQFEMNMTLDPNGSGADRLKDLVQNRSKP